MDYVSSDSDSSDQREAYLQEQAVAAASEYPSGIYGMFDPSLIIGQPNRLPRAPSSGTTQRTVVSSTVGDASDARVGGGALFVCSVCYSLTLLWYCQGAQFCMDRVRSFGGDTIIGGTPFSPAAYVTCHFFGCHIHDDEELIDWPGGNTCCVGCEVQTAQFTGSPSSPSQRKMVFLESMQRGGPGNLIRCL